MHIERAVRSNSSTPSLQRPGSSGVASSRSSRRTFATCGPALKLPAFASTFRCMTWKHAQSAVSGPWGCCTCCMDACPDQDKKRVRDMPDSCPGRTAERQSGRHGWPPSPAPCRPSLFLRRLPGRCSPRMPHPAPGYSLPAAAPPARPARPGPRISCAASLQPAAISVTRTQRRLSAR